MDAVLVAASSLNTAERLTIAVAFVALVLTAIGVVAGTLQVRAANRNTKAGLIMRLAEDWRSQEIYNAVRTVNVLRATWKKTGTPISGWRELAETWVLENAPSAGREVSESWRDRRTTSQFIGKMGWLVQKGFLTPDDLFGVVPETGRLLVVLIPLETAIREHYAGQEGPPLAGWDQPVGKWEFRRLWSDYSNWARTAGIIDLHWADWDEIVGELES